MKVFIVHAAVEKKKTEFLRQKIESLGHKVVLLEDLLPEGDITTKLLNAAKSCDKAIVLYSLNDKRITRGALGYKKVARENVVFELGLFVGLFGFKRTLVIRSESTKIDLPSDIRNIEYVNFSFKGNVLLNKLEKFL